MKCPRKHCKNNALISKIYGVLPCQKCQDGDAKLVLSPGPEFYNIGKLHRVQQERDQHGKDILQPFLRNQPNPEFAKAYPEMAHKYYRKEELAKL